MTTESIFKTEADKKLFQSLFLEQLAKQIDKDIMSNYYEPKKHDSMYLGGEKDWQQLWPKLQELPSEKMFRTPKPAFERQVGGSHYKDKGSSMQPWAIIDAWELDFYGGNVLKYLLRAKHKGGLEDLQKARHYLDKMIEDADDQ